MKEAAEVTGSILFLIASWTFRVVWGVVKVAIFLAILWGAVKNFSNTSLPVIGDIVIWAKTAAPSFLGASFFSWVAENWMVFAILFIFVNAIFSRWVIKELSETSGYTRIFIGTVMNYFQLGTETTSLMKMRESGIWTVMKEGLIEGIVTGILGIKPPDDRFSAKTVRLGKEVHLSDDLKEAVGSDADRQEQEQSL